MTECVYKDRYPLLHLSLSTDTQVPERINTHVHTDLHVHAAIEKRNTKIKPFADGNLNENICKYLQEYIITFSKGCDPCLIIISFTIIDLKYSLLLSIHLL